MMNDGTMARSPLDLTAEIVAAHVGHNHVAVEAVPMLIQDVYRALVDAVAGPTGAAEAPERRPPAVPIKKSVFGDYIVCLEDGKKLKSLKRHLQTSFNMTPEQYRARWGLLHDYPMVAPSYAERRSAIAKSFGLGRRKSVAKAEAQTPEPTVMLVPARRAKGSRG